MAALRQRETFLSRLARSGFVEPERARRLLESPSLGELGRNPLLLESAARAADPDLALASLARLLDAAPDPAALRDTLAASLPLRQRLLTVLGASIALGEHIVRHPGTWHELESYEVGDMAPGPERYRHDMLAAVGAREVAAEHDVCEPRDPVRDSVSPATLTGAAARDALRVAYRSSLLGIAARDLTGAIDVARAADELSDLADATLEAALAVARAELPPHLDADACRLAVVGMGKCGGRELNYVSDVDVVFVAEPAEGAAEPAAMAAANELAATMMRVCSDTTAEGTIWPVDAALRPEGRAGSLVRTLTSHVAYYKKWAKTWEFQALLKARPVAGDVTLGQAYVAELAPLVWHAAERPGFVADVQAMRRRVVEHVPARIAERELKLGPGGLRDIEFAVQLLQLVHGRADESLRATGTLPALTLLAAGGYVGRADAASLDEAYRFLRTLEHRLQLTRLRRTHTLPEDETELRRLGRSLDMTQDPVVQLRATWRAHAREVRRLHEKLFYRPLLTAVAQLPADDSRLTPRAATARLEALGYADPQGALRHLEALTSGVSRRAAIQRTLLPVMLGWFADAADPDGGLLAFRRVSEALGDTHWYLRLLRDEGAAAQRLARVLASGRYAPDLLLRAPEAVALLGGDDGLVPRDEAALRSEMLAGVGRADTPERAITGIRAVRRRELFRIATADLLGLADINVLGEALTAVTRATLVSALATAEAVVREQHGGALPTRLAVIAMGRFGGHELNYGSDADVLFVHEPEPGADERAATEAAHAVAEQLRRLLQHPTPDPPLVIDAGLRPEGRQGPLVRTLASYAAYYERWSQPWESQALLRAEPVAGDADVGRRFIDLVDPLRYPAAGLDAPALREIRRIKARVESERLPRGADPATHTKLGPGALADVEWTAQLLQLRYGATVPRLRTTRTRAALRAAVTAGLLAADDGLVLDEAWTTATRIRNGVMIVRGRPGDSVPVEPRELAGVASYLRRGTSSPQTVVEDYRRRTRRARSIIERVFYG